MRAGATSSRKPISRLERIRLKRPNPTSPSRIGRARIESSAGNRDSPRPLARPSEVKLLVKVGTAAHDHESHTNSAVHSNRRTKSRRSIVNGLCRTLEDRYGSQVAVLKHLNHPGLFAFELAGAKVSYLLHILPSDRWPLVQPMIHDRVSGGHRQISPYSHANVLDLRQVC